MECNRNIPILPLANWVNFWGNVLRHATIEPRSVPKRSFAPIAKGDSCSGVKDLHVAIVARVSGTRPNLRVVFPFKPRPPKTKRRGKLFQVEDAKAAINLRPANDVPTNFAIALRGFA
jgi:hypothetical protein